MNTSARVPVIFFTFALLLLGQADLLRAAGPVLQQDCTVSWDANTEPDLAGYRVYFGKLLTQLKQVADMGLRTSVHCSDAGVTLNGQWFASVTAYDVTGNESPFSPALPFELAGLADPVPPPQLLAPTSVQLQMNQHGFQLTWLDPNLSPVSHRISVYSWVENSPEVRRLQTMVVPPGVTMFRFFQPAAEPRVCVRIRGESGLLFSWWARNEELDATRFCFVPDPPAPSIDQPILASTIFPEPQHVTLRILQAGFELGWDDPGPNPIAHRIEVMSGAANSTDQEWFTLAVLPPGKTKFTYPYPIDVEQVCLRVRREVGRVVSLWAAANGLGERHFCYSPGQSP
ncbi:MAG: hypothetical protein HXY51_07795 [Nitrospirae bacterium]|nr:hypothetical protein [Nitrospirota bacterium]